MSQLNMSDAGSSSSCVPYLLLINTFPLLTFRLNFSFFEFSGVYRDVHNKNSHRIHLQKISMITSNIQHNYDDQALI